MTKADGTSHHCAALLIALLIAAFAVSGCGKTGSTKQVNPAAFDSAPAEIKNKWDNVLNAAKSNDYATVILTCRSMMSIADLSSEQRDAINAMQTTVGDKMFDAAQKGDPDATKALQEIRAHWR